MDNKKDIYMLWVQYTTKNEESYFREFIERFVSIWHSQIVLDFNSENCPLWNAVQADSGPHLGRLPDELLPAIGKFIIIAQDSIELNDPDDMQIHQIAILIDCLVIICRNFENILAIIKYDYETNLIAILASIYKKILSPSKSSTPSIAHIFQSFSQFLEVLYDPFLTWRSFLRGHYADYQKLSYTPHTMHVEIIPFIYDCFQTEDIQSFPEIGVTLLNALGAIICGSQRNGMRAICPATVSIVINILSEWEYTTELRAAALKSFSLMVISLQQTSPEERQIDGITLMSYYCDVLQKLLGTQHFTKSNEEFFQIVSESDEDDNDDDENANKNTIDVNCLSATLNNIENFLSYDLTSKNICSSIDETILVDILLTLPKQIEDWNINSTLLICSTINALAVITRHSMQIIKNLRSQEKLSKFFKNLKAQGVPSIQILNACLNLSFDMLNERLILPEIMIELIEWLPIMHEHEQTYLSQLILDVCIKNHMTKSIACEYHTIKAVCICLDDSTKLSEVCIQNLIKLIEELSKISLIPIELKLIFRLLSQERKFPATKQLLQTLVTVSLQSLSSTNLCSEYLLFNNENDGIIVPDIKNWTISGSYGFIFHILLRLNEQTMQNNNEKSTEQNTKRIMLLNLRTNNNTGFEVFIQNNETIIVAALTRREYLTTAVSAKSLADNKWHYLTVAITPPKRPFSYSQINVYIDFIQKISATLKVQPINEHFIYCSIGSALPTEMTDTAIATRNKQNSSLLSRTTSEESNSSSNSSQSGYKGMLPSILERTLSTNVSSYFTLPLRTQTSFDPNVKNFPIGMQDTVFGTQTNFYGHIGGVIFAEPTTPIKNIFDAGLDFASIFSQDNDLFELTSRFVFCFSPAAYWQGKCQDLIPGGKFPALIHAQLFRIIKIQDTINSIGGIQTILPILEKIIQNEDSATPITDRRSSSSSVGQIRTPTTEELTDWEVISSSLYTEWKMIQHPVANFLCFLRYLTHQHDNNQENLLSSDCLQIIGQMLEQCPSNHFEVNALMATHLLIESIQNHAKNSNGNMSLLDILYTEIAFNFAIWENKQFQITLGHIQYLGAMIKNDRKYFRKKFGVQFFLDVVRQYYCIDCFTDDAKTIRATLFAIIRFYLQKDVNIKEISAIIAFLASVRECHVLAEFLEIITFHIKSKSCRDQMVLLLHEPQAAHLLYNCFIEKLYNNEVQEAAIRLINILLLTTRVHQKYKQILRLYDEQHNCSLFPGFFSYMIPIKLSSTIIFYLVDIMLGTKIDYTGLLYLVHQLSACDISIKIEMAKRLLQMTFVRQNSVQMLAKQVGWQESIARLLIRRPITNFQVDAEEKRKSIGINLDVLLEDTNSFNNQTDLISFTDPIADGGDGGQQQRREQDLNDGGLILNEIQASVTEAANAIESEIKEVAEFVSGAVVENVSSVFSVIRQTTHDIQDTFESIGLGSSIETNLVKQRTESISSDSSTQSPSITTKKETTTESNTLQFEYHPDNIVDNEEQLVYLVTNVLFNIFWRGVSNDHPQCWKERGQVLACINLLALNNELITSHLSLRLRILELAVEAALSDLAEHNSQTLHNQENASQILRMVYDLIVLGSNEDESKKCSTKLLEGVLGLLDALMIFQQGLSDDWPDMIRLCFGLLLKCSHHTNAGVVAMATAKLHAILQNRNSEKPEELAYLLFSINRALCNAVEVCDSEQYSFLMPVMKALLQKCHHAFSLEVNLPDLPSTYSGPVFFNDFQTYSQSRRWRQFIENMVKPSYEAYQKEIELNLWEEINCYWAECYEACKAASKQRFAYQTENRKQFQQKIVRIWKVRQVEETTRANLVSLQQKTKCRHIKKKWKTIKRFLYGSCGPWFTGESEPEFWILSNHENIARMRLKLEPQLYPDKHDNAASLRDNATNAYDTKKISELDSTIKTAVVRDFLSDDENFQLEEELRQSIEAQQTQQDIALEKSIISQDCELITLMTKVKGRIEVNQTIFTFVDLSPPNEDGTKYDFCFTINKIREVHLRKFNLRRSALEVFLIDQTSYFLNFTTKTRNKVFTKILSLQPPNILYGSGRSPAELLRTSGLTQKWVTREISNFEYLMYLNTIAGRSYNDLSQYPVFPWILSDYSSEILDLTDPNSFRDLSKPVGVINAKNEEEVRAKYESFEDPTGTIPKFHFGTHYSNSGGVLHYLLRIEPFTSLHIELQSGRFDVADRQFHSIPQTWKLLMDNPNDVKELIPEFFYFPEFLKNMNGFDLGHLQTKEKVDHVILPPWATTPEEFIAIHRRALESEYVSQNLHHWIDLIFGFKQKGPRSVEALNVFYYCSYEGAVDLDKITNPVEREAVEGMINNFGQVPSQLLREPHPRRLTQDETAIKLLRCELKRPDLSQFLDKVTQYYCEFSTPIDPIIYLSTPRSPPRSFLQLSPDVLVSISRSSILGCNSWMSNDKDRGFLLEIDATTTNMKNRKKIFGPFHPSQKIHSQLFAVSTDGKQLYVGGIWDNSLRVYNLHKGKVVASVTRHFDVITCLALDNCGSYLVTGSRDCTCIIWSIQNQQQSGSSSSSSQSNNIPPHVLTAQASLYSITQLNTQNYYSPNPLKVLYGHDDAISSVAIYTELDMVVSGSLDGTVNVYTIQDGQYVRTLKPRGCTEFCVQISYVTVSYHGHIAFSALDDASHSVHVYSINGTSLGSKYVSGRVTGLTTASEYLVVADDAGDITISRLHGLKPIFDIPLHIPIQTVVVTTGNTHILAPLRDGRLAVITVQIPMGSNKKHSVLNV